MLSFEQKGELRWAVLAFLYERQVRSPWPEDALLKHLNDSRSLLFTISLQDLRETLAMLEGLGFVANAGRLDPLNTAGRYAITPNGIITHERANT
jgi:hypothetical protein